MELKIGDRVKIREDLQPICYGKDRAVMEMREYAGCIARVVETADGVCFLDIDDGYWTWTPEMLIPVAPASCPCGLLSLGLQAKEVTMEQYTEQVRKDPVLSRKYFRRFTYCPDCARLIDWGQVE